jgi:hypothetical protein
MKLSNNIKKPIVNVQQARHDDSNKRYFSKLLGFPRPESAIEHAEVGTTFIKSSFKGPVK